MKNYPEDPVYRVGTSHYDFAARQQARNEMNSHSPRQTPEAVATYDLARSIEQVVELSAGARAVAQRLRDKLLGGAPTPEMPESPSPEGYLDRAAFFVDRAVEDVGAVLVMLGEIEKRFP